MLDTVSLKRRKSHSLEIAGRRPALDRVRDRLAALECLHLRARSHGHHIVIEPVTTTNPKDQDAVARLIELGSDVYGLAFRRPEGGWEPIALIDSLDEIVWEMATAMTPDPPEASTLD
jgi:hypothetical protein